MKIDCSSVTLSLSNSRLGLLDQASVSVLPTDLVLMVTFDTNLTNLMPCVNEVVWEWHGVRRPDYKNITSIH